MRCFNASSFDESVKYAEEKNLNATVKVCMKHKRKGSITFRNLYNEFLRREANGEDMIIYRMIEHEGMNEKWFYLDFNLDSGLLDKLAYMGGFDVQYYGKMVNQYRFEAVVKY